jgi:hypothetical protein
MVIFMVILVPYNSHNKITYLIAHETFFLIAHEAFFLIAHEAS